MLLTAWKSPVSRLDGLPSPISRLHCLPSLIIDSSQIHASKLRPVRQSPSSCSRDTRIHKRFQCASLLHICAVQLHQFIRSTIYRQPVCFSSDHNYSNNIHTPRYPHLYLMLHKVQSYPYTEFSYSLTEYRRLPPPSRI